MILVILGTQDKPFQRLLEAVNTAVEVGAIQDRIIVQAGTTVYTSKHMEIFDLLPMDQFDQFLSQADLVITHAGVGSIVSALKLGKTVIAAARSAQLGEHANDHQMEILEEFSKEGYILPLLNFDELPQVIETSKTFVPAIYQSTTVKVLDEIRNFITQDQKRKRS